MPIKASINKSKITEAFKQLCHKELLVALYLLYFISGIVSFSSGYIFYNEYRVIEVMILLIFGAIALSYKVYLITKAEMLFLVFIIWGSFFWDNYLFTITDLLLAYLLYKSFCFLSYSTLITKIIVLLSLPVFLLFPVSLWEYINTGIYYPNWYPMGWNIRVYDSYFFVLSVLAVWLYITENKYKNIYLLFLLLAFLSILLNAGRSAALAYTVFIAVIVICNRTVRWQLLVTYGGAWLAYIGVTYLAMTNLANSSTADLQIARTTTSLRYDLWMNAFNCWKQSPLMGCGFYQLGSYEYLAAHPHNLFIQVLSETGLIGFGILAYMMVAIGRRINWSQKHNYFIVATFLAMGIELSFSGIYIYPVTQIALLWLFVFLLKNPEFSYTKSFEKNNKQKSRIDRVLSLVIYLVIAVWFIYLCINTSAFSVEAPIAPPRFWTYGYQLF